MRIPGLKMAKKVGRQWRGHFVKGGVILGYHRVVDLVFDPYGICVSPANFENQMAFLCEHMCPLPLVELVERALSGTLPRRAVAVTFDDGYADNLAFALPILVRYGIPSTFFVTTGHRGGEFWWDELSRLVSSEPLVASGTAVLPSEGKLLPVLYRTLLPMPEKDRRDQLDRLWESVGGKQEGPGLLLTDGELVQIASCDLVEIGSHSVTHAWLDSLTREEQMIEICSSRELLEDVVQKPVHSFSYPNGRYSEDTLVMTRQAGYELACTSAADVVWRRSDRYRLPRVWAQNRPAPEFADSWIVAKEAD